MLLVCQGFYNRGVPTKEILTAQFARESEECQKTAAFIIRQQSAQKMRALNNREVTKVFDGLSPAMCEDLMSQQSLIDSIAPPSIMLEEDLTAGIVPPAP